jgi:hypothetical protein
MAIWNNVVRFNEEKNATDDEINEIIETEIKSTVERIGLKYKSSMYDPETSNIKCCSSK